MRNQTPHKQKQQRKRHAEWIYHEMNKQEIKGYKQQNKRNMLATDVVVVVIFWWQKKTTTIKSFILSPKQKSFSYFSTFPLKLFQ